MNKIKFGIGDIVMLARPDTRYEDEKFLPVGLLFRVMEESTAPFCVHVGDEWVVNELRAGNICFNEDQLVLVKGAESIE